MCSNSNSSDSLRTALAARKLQTVNLKDLEIESQQIANLDSPLFTSIEKLGVVEPPWLYIADTTYVIDGRKRIACLIEQDAVTSVRAHVFSPQDFSRSLAVILRLHLNPALDHTLLSQTIIELCTDVSAENLQAFADLVEPFIAPQLLSSLDVIVRLPQPLVAEWIARKVPLRSIKRARHLPKELLRGLANTIRLQPSNGDWRRLLELLDEIYRRDKKSDVILSILEDAATVDGLVKRLEAMRSPTQTKRSATVKEAWRALNPPKGAALNWSAKKEGSNSLSLAFQSAGELERRLEALKQRLTDDDFRAYIDRL